MSDVSVTGLEDAVKALKALGAAFPKKEQQRLLAKAAVPLVKAAKANIPDSDEPHYRYRGGSKKKGKGKGEIVAVYYPGNLRKSIRTKRLSKSTDVFVGPVTAKSPFGSFGNGKVDGYYAHLVEYGTVFQGGVGYMRRALDATKGKVRDNIIEGVKNIVLKIANGQ